MIEKSLLVETAMSVTEQITDELLLQAFQYVAGDMSVAQMEAFESQMLASDVVCEAVAEATQLSSLVAAAADSPASALLLSAERSVAPSSFSARSTALLAAVCCCLLLLVALGNAVWNSGTAEGIVKSDSTLGAHNYSEAELLVSTWVESVDPDAVSDTEPSESFSRELNVPDWMLAAVTLADIEERAGTDMPVDGSLSEAAELF